jgi:hypothetical protein
VKATVGCAPARPKGTQVIHVNQLVIRSNAKRGECNPPIAVRGKSRNQKVVYGHELILSYEGKEVGRFIYSPTNPLDCGAKLWMETNKLQISPVVWAKGKKDE